MLINTNVVSSLEPGYISQTYQVSQKSLKLAHPVVGIRMMTIADSIL